MPITAKHIHLYTKKRCWPENVDSRPKRCRMDELQETRFVDKLVNRCVKIGDWNDKKMYAIPFTQSNNFDDGTGMMKRFVFGKKSDRKRKTILLLGATGCGKTSLISNFINHILGVDWQDPFRFQLEESGVRFINIYDIHHAEGFRIPHSLTIVDVPGFGDPARDGNIMKMLGKLFQWDCGIQELDAVGLVANSYSLKPIQTLESILSIFGKDIKDNINLLLTFASSQDPSVLDAISEANLPFPSDVKTGKPIHYKFNNCAVSHSRRNADHDGNLWRMNKKNFKKFFANLATKKVKSLAMTRLVPVKQKQLEATMEQLQILIQTGLEIKNEIKSLQQIEDCSNNGRILTKKTELPAGLYVTNCDKCGVTCSLYRSVLLDPICCWFCPDKCKWAVHTMKSTCWLEVISPGIKAHNRLKTLRREVEENMKAVLKHRMQVTLYMEQIDKIALRPFTVTSRSIELMINIEQMEKLPGFQVKIKSLESRRQRFIDRAYAV